MKESETLLEQLKESVAQKRKSIKRSGSSLSKSIRGYQSPTGLFEPVARKVKRGPSQLSMTTPREIALQVCRGQQKFQGTFQFESKLRKPTAMTPVSTNKFGTLAKPAAGTVNPDCDHPTEIKERSNSVNSGLA